MAAVPSASYAPGGRASGRTGDSTGRRTGEVVLLVVLSLFAFLWLVPVIWMVSMSLMPNDVLQRTTAGLLPWPITAKNFSDILRVSSTPRWLFNSVVVAVCMTVFTLVLSSLAGYAFARLRFPGRAAALALVLAGLMVPEHAVFIPLHTMFSAWELHNTHLALFTPRLAVPIGVFLMFQFFKAIPRELEEAAELDKASRFKIFTRIMLPLSVPALTTLGLFTFFHAWNDFLWPLVSGNRTDMYTITVGLASLQGNFAMTEGLGFVMAAAVFASAPMILLYVVFQRYIVRGIALGSGR